jgi:hypothetical protein
VQSGGSPGSAGRELGRMLARSIGCRERRRVRRRVGEKKATGNETGSAVKKARVRGRGDVPSGADRVSPACTTDINNIAKPLQHRCRADINPTT